jgi:hypothetical protein
VGTPEVLLEIVVLLMTVWASFLLGQARFKRFMHHSHVLENNQLKGQKVRQF